MKKFIELEQSLELAKEITGIGRSEVIAEVQYEGTTFPIVGFVLGSQDPAAPTLGLFGGVHGIERIGCHVTINYLKALIFRYTWDEALQNSLKKCRIVAIPIVNPVGTLYGWRSNARGVDLMRNSPVEQEANKNWLIGGHRIGNWLPWYRGTPNDMEIESRALIDFVRKHMFSSTQAIALDLHSGFGWNDQLWYPYAKSRDLFPARPHVEKFAELLNNSYPYHIYKIEPQSLHYTTHGDLWDYMFDEFRKASKNCNQVFLPFTLEMGSWLWVKKNPRQLLSFSGLFNPTLPHRFRRIMRRHWPLFAFCLQLIQTNILTSVKYTDVDGDRDAS